MDISVLASVGSFVMSEKVLKPKASVLTILGCLLAYDLTTKTHDSSSLRVYRGPALLAFTLMMCAFSLRTWRRNGVACDELLFLPGTEHGALHGVDRDQHHHHHRNENNINNNNSSPPGLSASASSSGSPPPPPEVLPPPPNEGDVAAGGPTIVELAPTNLNRSNNDAETSNNNDNNMVASSRSPARRKNTDNSIASFVDSWDMDDEEEEVDEDEEGDNNDNRRNDNNSNEMEHLMEEEQFHNEGDEEHYDDEDDGDEEEEEEDDDDGDMTRLLSRSDSWSQRRQVRTRATSHPVFGGTRGTGGRSSSNNASGPVHRFRENHPRITRIGSFFFFRSSTSSTQNAAYAPSGPSVLGAAIDLSMPILFNFHLFIDAYNHIEAYGSETPAKILPLIFLSVLIVRCFIPPGRRGHFWGTMKFTFMAPFHRVRFRDAFIGDFLTSLVRPLQDVLFALSYYVTVLYGTATGRFGLSAGATILEQSWLLHNVVLPSVALLPLWWKFLQTLRQCYDTGQRWPHLGNALKYLTAALVVLYGMTHPEDRRSSWWLVSFFLTLAYQIAWDVFVDWELIEVAPRTTDDTVVSESASSWFANSSAYRANSPVLTLRMRLWHPLAYIYAVVPKLSQVQLRSRRLYKSEAFYWRILFYNTVCRFTWMLCFIPAYRMSASGQEHVTTFSSDTNSYVGVLLPIAEILRRTFWGFLLLENKTIQIQEADPNFAVVHRSVSRDSLPLLEEGSEMQTHDSDTSKNRHLPTWLGASSTHHANHPYHHHHHEGGDHAATMATTSGGNLPLSQRVAQSCVCTEELKAQLFVAELSLWAVAFVGLGLWATT